MNGKKAKELRRAAKFDPNAPRYYTNEEATGTKKANGERRDYQLLKKYYKGDYWLEDFLGDMLHD